MVQVTLFEKTPAGKVSTSELFNGKKVVLFGVPGAFTPGKLTRHLLFLILFSHTFGLHTGCSKTHLPGYIANADEIKGKGVNEIVCISVNDPFVMDAWSKDTGAEGKIRLLADTNAEFVKALGIDVDLTAALGSVRSKRFSAVVEDGVIKVLNVEPDNTGTTCSLVSCIFGAFSHFGQDR